MTNENETVVLLSDGPSAKVRRVGVALGRTAVAGDVLGLVGTLGAGKTWITRAITVGLDVPDKERVHSPTFSLLHVYKGRLPVYHADLYRLQSEYELYELDLFAQASNGVLIVEWANNFPSVFPEQTVWLTMEKTHPLRRKITARCSHSRGRQWIADVVSALSE